jgi:hypothetical protein
MSRPRKNDKVRGRRRRPWLYVEVLEDRCLPATITVTSLSDNLIVDGQVTLREALQAANTNHSVDVSVVGDPGRTPTQGSSRSGSRAGFTTGTRT